MNRNSMGSRAGTAFKNNLGGAAIGAPSRLGTAGRVIHLSFREIQHWAELDLL